MSDLDLDLDSGLQSVKNHFGLNDFIHVIFMSIIMNICAQILVSYLNNTYLKFLAFLDVDISCYMAIIITFLKVFV